MQAQPENLAGQSFVDEALANFEVLIDDLDFEIFFKLMGIGRLQFLRHRQMFVELKSMHIGLWRLALSHSFPCDADAMFAEFLKRYASSHTSRLDRQIVERAPGYWSMILPTGNADFTSVARHLVSFTDSSNGDLRAVTLKLALRIHNAYNLIFERLI